MLDNFLETLFSHKHKNFALLYLDLNGFKKINDNFGHKVGNYVIKIIAKRLAEHTSLDHLVSRIGGDEFLIVIPNYGSIGALNKMAEKYIKTVEEEIELKMINTSLSCSIGISLYPQHSKNKSDLIVYADRAMMKAKKNKEYKYCFYEREINDLGYEIASLESDMYHALKNDEFVLYFQPQVDARNKQIMGIEALIRWQHPTLGLIDPKYFLEMAKNVGLILTLEYRIIKQSMYEVSQWHVLNKYHSRVSINLSMQKLEDKNFIQEVRALLEECQCKGEWIEFEITETKVISNIAKVRQVFAALKEMNITVAVDDFGTGYSSLSYLAQLQIDKIKIDKIFVDQLLAKDNNIIIIDAIIAIANSLHYSVVAEGVETKAQLDCLEEHGCHIIQGFYYYKPMSADEIMILLDA